jgi:HlyD family secretion protein
VLLDRLSSLAQLACGLILATALAWGVLGRVPGNVTGNGILLPLGGWARLPHTEADGQLEALLYVDSQDGKNIRPGMTVEVSPTHVQSVRHGAILAVVHAVDRRPSTSDRLIQLLQDHELVDTVWARTAGAPLAVHARLRWDPASPSGYRWTSGKGPDVPLLSGSRFVARVVIPPSPP